MIVYVDVLIALNFIVNYLLLLISARFCGGILPRGRITIAALIGAFFSLTIFLPHMDAGINIILKIVMTVVLSAAAGSYSNRRGFLKRTFMLLAVSFLFSGFMLFITLFSTSKNGFYYNGIFYYNISAWKLLAYSIIAYIICSIYQKLFKKGLIKEKDYQVLLSINDKSLLVPGIMDSQNHLTDLFSGTPVVIGSPSLLKGIMPFSSTMIVHQSFDELSKLQGVRLIPCSTVAGQDVLPAFRPDRMVLLAENESTEITDVYIAVSSQLHGDAGGKLILNPALSGRAVQITNESGA